MAQEQLKNMYLVTAPAGSGKTTTIRKWIKEQLVEHPKDQILCITYTNRAAEELQKEIESDLVWIGTIHAFLNELVKPYFKNPKIVELYMESFGSRIDNYLNVEKMPDHTQDDKKKKEQRKKSIERYKKKMGFQEKEEVTREAVGKKLTSITYGETSNTRLLYGQLSHDDLINFSYDMIVKYPAITNKIKNRFRTIYLDEYQDSAAKVLQIFYKAVLGTKVKFYLFGDKMQQIYSNYDGEFEEELSAFCRDKKLNTNYRSSKEIVSILNRIYNDPEYEQKTNPDEEKWKSDFKPRILLTKEFDKTVENERNKDVLTLFLMNSSRFKSAGAGNLFHAYNNLEAYRYAIGKYTAADILQDASEENPDDLFRMFVMIRELLTFFEEKRYGKAITLIKKNTRMFCGRELNVLKHSEKSELKAILKKLCEEYKSLVTIGEFVTYLTTNHILAEDYAENLDMDERYKDVKDVELEEVRNLFAYLEKQNISTQHGVKGESHDSVLFVAEKSRSTPNVKIYEFFDLFSTVDVSLTTFEKFYYEYKKMVDKFASISGADKVNEDFLKHNKSTIKMLINDLHKKFSDNIYYQKLCKEEYDKFLEKETVKNLVKCFKSNLNKVYGTLQAYRIFYVGCSRARKNLEIIVDETKLSVDSDTFIKKFEKVGFEVKCVEEAVCEEVQR